jgi:hypothetical protein
VGTIPPKPEALMLGTGSEDPVGAGAAVADRLGPEDGARVVLDTPDGDPLGVEVEVGPAAFDPLQGPYVVVAGVEPVGLADAEVEA